MTAAHMKPAARLRLGPAAAGLLLLALSACTLADDITPPPGSGFRPSPAAVLPTAAVPQVQPTSAVPTPAEISGPVFPAERPLAVDGARLFLDRCAACHGERGNGGGTMAAQLQEAQAQLPDFSTPTLARSAKPSDWFKVITQGRIDRFMPPWGEELSESQRWSLVAYLAALSTPQEQLDRGRTVYTAQCAACHGESGQGDGPQAADLARPPADLSDLAYMAGRSQADLLAALEASPEAHTVLAPLSEADRWAALDFIRSFSYEYFAPGSPLPALRGLVTGQVTNGTADAGLPPGLSVRLHGFDDRGNVTTLTTTASLDGSFRFEAVEYQSGTQFVVSAEHQGLTFNSEVAGFPAEGQALELPLRIYETTATTEALLVSRMHMFVEFPLPGQMVVGQLFILSNLGDRALAGGPGSPTVEFALPAGALGVNVDGAVEGQDYVRTDTGLALTTPVFPGQAAAQILLSFSLPYERGLSFEQSLPYPVESLNVMISDPVVKLSGGGLVDQGVQNIQGVSFQNYTGGEFAAGGTLAFEMSGDPAAQTTAAAAAPAPASSAGLAVGLGALAAVLIGVGVWWLRRSRLGPPDEATREELLEAIAELDEDYEAGQVDEREYQKERAALKAELQKLWNR